MSLNKTVLLVLSLFIAGCAGTPIKENTSQAPSSPNLKTQQLQAHIAQLEEENLALKQQLDAAKEAEARMPTGKEIQAALKNAGIYTGAIDGAIGRETKEAIRKFQAANNLNSDGTVGSRTWSILKKYLPAAGRPAEKIE